VGPRALDQLVAILTSDQIARGYRVINRTIERDSGRSVGALHLDKGGRDNRPNRRFHPSIRRFHRRLARVMIAPLLYFAPAAFATATPFCNSEIALLIALPAGALWPCFNCEIARSIKRSAFSRWP
jgi:hypothetical protein